MGENSKSYKHFYNGLKTIFHSRLRINFLLGIAATSFSLIALVFGINSVTIEQFVNPDSVTKYNFTDIQNIFRFPIDQNNLRNGESKKLTPPSGGKKFYTQWNLIVIDKTKSIDHSKNYCDSIYSNLQRKGIESSYDKANLKNFDLRSLIVDYCYLHVHDKQKTDIFYLIPNTEDQAFLKSRFESNTSTYNDEDFIKGIDLELQNTKNGKTEFSIFLSELYNKLKNTDSIKVLTITILSDFDNEDSKAGEEAFISSLRAIKELNKKIVWNLVVLPRIKYPTESDEKYALVLDSINSFINRWYEVCEFSITKFPDVFFNGDFDSKINRLFPSEILENNHKETLNIIYPATFRGKEGVDGSINFRYDEANRLIGSEKGNYVLTFSEMSKKLKDPLLLDYRLGHREDRKIVFNNYPIVVSKQEIILSSDGEGNWGQLGKLIVSDLENDRLFEIPVWKKRRLNETGIAYYIVLLNCFLFSLILLFWALAFPLLSWRKGLKGQFTLFWCLTFILLTIFAWLKGVLSYLWSTISIDFVLLPNLVIIIIIFIITAILTIYDLIEVKNPWTMKYIVKGDQKLVELKKSGEP
ncbi:hypothetical protein QQ020_21715 [Fulvivirgaceae bacterium BMA12]|uniref:Uncharacterized protein n=1 Tax=Agaribacillus aureus TaxID=3051825 RepID=A0ABT8LBY0_9BACT|nr:hypothetical protein [Fulvivirgaceae bacterium BMA12]